MSRNFGGVVPLTPQNTSPHDREQVYFYTKNKTVPQTSLWYCFVFPLFVICYLLFIIHHLMTLYSCIFSLRTNSTTFLTNVSGSGSKTNFPGPR